jgi:mono/diheme cytochrome c family protein
MRIGPWIMVLGAVGCGGDKDEGAPTGDTGGQVTVEGTNGEYIAYLVSSGQADPANGKILYEREPEGCYDCHAIDGTGTADFPSLAERLPLLTDDQVGTVIYDGIDAQPGKIGMPPYGPEWTYQEMADVTLYIRNAFAP